MKTQKIGITFSSFDLLHAGHIKMLEEAKTVCDYLIVGLQLDPSYDRSTKNKPTQTVVERYIQLKAVSAVDEIIPQVDAVFLAEGLIHAVHKAQILPHHRRRQHHAEESAVGQRTYL